MIVIKARYPDSSGYCQVYRYASTKSTLLLAAVIRCSTINRTSLDLKAWIEVDGKPLDEDLYRSLVDAIEHNAGPKTVEERLARLMESCK